MSKEYKNIDNVESEIKTISTEKKNKLFALWMSKQRLSGMRTLNLMWAIDDEWNKIYKQHRKQGFSAAQLVANERILVIFYGQNKAIE